MKNSIDWILSKSILISCFAMAILLVASCKKDEEPEEEMPGLTIIASFECEVSGSNSLTYNFTNQSLVDAVNNEAFTSSWDFGGTGTSTDKNPTHTFASPGSYEITLTVTASDGETDTETKTIVVEVSESMPMAAFITNEDPNQDFTFSFTNTSVVNGISDNSFTSSWDFGGDGTSTEESPTHTFSSEGIYEVTLTITAADGEVDSETDTINIELLLSTPVASFIANKDLNQELTFSFTNTSAVTGISDDSFTSSWDFGGDGSSTQQSPSHTFSAEGFYDVTLTVTAADGETDTATETIEVTVFTNKYARITDSKDDDTGELGLSIDSIQTGRLSFAFRLVEGSEMDIKDAFINVAGTATTGDMSITEIRLKDNAPHEFREGASQETIASANFPEGMANVWIPIEISWDANGPTTPLYTVIIDGQTVITDAISTTNGGPGDVDDHIAAVLYGARNFQWKYNSNSSTSDGAYHVDNIIVYSSDSGTETVIFEDNFEGREPGENLSPFFNPNSPYTERTSDATVRAD